MLFTRNLLHAALAMFLCMLGLAGLYVMAYADVMAVSHLLIYVGGVLILILFGIMMTQTSVKSGESVNDLGTAQSGWFWPMSMGLTIFMGLFWVLGHRNWSNPVVFFLGVVAVLFATGFARMVLKRNTISVWMGIELMLNAANLNLVAFSRSDEQNQGMMMGLFVLVVGVCEMAIALAVIVQVYRQFKGIDIDQFSSRN